MTDAAFHSTVAFALVAGVATFFSPCAYPLLPGYVAFYASRTEGSDASIAGSLARGVVAGFGVLLAFGVVFGAAVLVGRGTLSNVTVFEPIVGAVLVVFGALVLFDRAPTVSIPLPKRRSSVLGFGIFGAGYALAAAGCFVPLVVGVLTAAVALPVGSAALVLGTYVGTIVALMISLTVATGVGMVAGGGRLAGHGRTLERVAGAVMIVAGLGQLYLAIFVLETIW